MGCAALVPGAPRAWPERRTCCPAGGGGQPGHHPAGAGAAVAGTGIRRVIGGGMMDSVAVFVRSISSGMQAAFLLARGRPEGLHHADSDVAGAARSFWAIAVALPAFICLRLLGGSGGAVQMNAGNATAIAQKL